MSTDFNDIVFPDDLNLDVADPEIYVDQSFGLIPEAWYDFVLTDFDFQVDKETRQFRNCVNVAIEIVSEDESLNGRKVSNLSIWTAQYERPKGSGIKASMIGDFIRTFDDSTRWSGPYGIKDMLERIRDQRIKGRAKLVWSAYDKDGFDQKGGAQLMKGTPEHKALRKQASVKGMRNFMQTSDGNYVPSAIGPLSGNTLEGRIEIGTFTPASKHR